MLGKMLGRYRVVEKIGAGGMGVVYRGRDERLDRDVALKVLPAGALADEAARKRFRKEALALSQLNHPNIATVHDFDTQGGVDFLVMEYIPGITLDEKAATGPIPEKEISRLGTQLAQGLAAAHQVGVVHRDLKPANLRVTPDGRLKILDFGLARLLCPADEGNQAAVTASLSDTHAVAGTLPYMSPEQLQGKRVDARSDIYAAGAVLYEMATAQRAFPESLGPRLIDAILHHEPHPPRALNNRVSPALERIILKALDKEPDRRYQSAKELGVDLERLGVPTAEIRPGPHPGFDRLWSRAGVAALAGALAALLAVLVGLNVGGWRDRVLGRANPARIQSLAVLPLENLSGDKEQEYFADGMTEALITDLGKIGALRVISRTSVMQYKSTRKPLPQIARDLNVDAVVEGSVERSGERVRITAQLIQAAPEKHLWADSYERDLRDILSLQSEVARDIASKIQIKLTPQEQVRLASSRPVNPAALDSYLLGKYHAARENPNDNNAAIAALERTVAADPDFAAAYAELARAYAIKAFYFAPKQKQWEEKGFVAAEKAVSLDKTSAEAYYARGLLLWRPSYRFPHEQAVQEYRRALALNPNLDDAHHQIALIYLHIGLLDKATDEWQRALAINPSHIDSDAIMPRVYLYRGKYEQALAGFQGIPREFNPLVLVPHTAWCLFQVGRKQEASAQIDEFLKSNADPGCYLASIRAMILASAGDQRGAEELIRRAAEGKGYGHFHHTAYAIASSYALLGKPQAAMLWLRFAADDGFPCYSLFERDPNLDGIRKDPQFIAFMKKLHQQWEHYKATL